MKWRAVLRGAAALACALAFHAAIVACAVGLGWFSTDAATFPELDMTSVDLSFSDTPDETAAQELMRRILEQEKERAEERRARLREIPVAPNQRDW